MLWSTVILGCVTMTAGRAGAQPSRDPERRDVLDGLEPTDRPGEYRWTRDGSVLVWIPAGSFAVRRAGGVAAIVSGGGFFLGKYELTIGQYRRFAVATGRPTRIRPLRCQYRLRPPPLTSDCTCPTVALADDDPVVNVTWDDAAAYCAWAGLGLPTASEWEFAARYPDGRPYPWGDAPPDGTRLNSRDRSASACANVFVPSLQEVPDWNDGFPVMAPVTAFAAGASALGLLNLSGNVSEWVMPSNRTERRQARGGSWFSQLANCQPSYGFVVPEGHSAPNIGFRVCLKLDVSTRDEPVHAR